MRAIRTRQCVTAPSTKFSERGSLVPGLAAHVLDELLLACTDKPSMFVEVDKDEAWRAAMLRDQVCGGERHLGADRSAVRPPSHWPNVGLQVEAEQG
jgi:hypothetical protein